MTVFALVGPTATGKTSLSLEVAEALGAEIVCCDSMVVYRGLDVGTAKPTARERARVAHHALDLVDPTEDFSVQVYQSHARAVLADLAGRGVPALLVGGSGLYLRAALDPLEFPPTDPAVRSALETWSEQHLRAELGRVDPAAAVAIAAGNTRRLVRALEVWRLTGRPFSSFKRAWDVFSPVPVAGLCLPPAEHARVVKERAEAMLGGGLLDETRALVATGASRTAAVALGYAEAAELLAGLVTAEQAARAIADRTRALARRQRAWFRSDPRVAWFGRATAAQLVSYYRAAGPVLSRARAA